MAKIHILRVSLTFVFLVVVLADYQLKEVEVKNLKDGTPYKVFTDEEIAKYDGAKVSLKALK